ncbi:MAG TPA: hypothetical protein VFD36_19495 [Kofleriaceae bacterium]|nr:hypothetical protein [Kofleriaceae bacterium]
MAQQGIGACAHAVQDHRQALGQPADHRLVEAAGVMDPPGVQGVAIVVERQGEIVIHGERRQLLDIDHEVQQPRRARRRLQGQEHVEQR